MLNFITSNQTVPQTRKKKKPRFLGLVYFAPKTKNFSRFSINRILRLMHEALNIDENKN